MAEDDDRTVTVENVEKIWNYLQSWKDSGGRLHGIIATYWDSSTTFTAPHVMNHFPVIEGLCILHARYNESSYRDKATACTDFLLQSFNPETHIFENAWGDAPPKHTGTVHQAVASGALLDVFSMTNDERYLQIALLNLHACHDRWPGMLLNGVANQALKYIQAVSKLKKIDVREFGKFVPHIRRYCVEIGAITKKMPWGGALIDQSMYVGFLMSVYEAKCLHGLKALVDCGVESEWASDTMQLLVRGIVNNLYVGNGLFASHIDYNEGLFSRLARYGFGAARRLPWPDQGLRLERFRRAVIHGMSNTQHYIAPVWLARIADLAYVFRAIEHYVDIDLTKIVHEVDQLLRASQLPHGGIPNTVGAWKKGWECWERFICSTRWNAYAFRYFCETTSTMPLLEDKPISTCEWGDFFVTVREDRDRVWCRINRTGKEFIWRKPS